MIHAILSKNLKPVISAMFETDADLTSVFHIESGAGLQGCIERTLIDLNTCDPSFRFYELRDGAEVIGFFGKEFDNYLTTIFVHPRFRKSEKMNEIWNLIRFHFDGVFYTSIYSKNTRAASFYRKRGIMTETFTTGSNHTALAFKFTNNKELICQ